MFPMMVFLFRFYFDFGATRPLRPIVAIGLKGVPEFRSCSSKFSKVSDFAVMVYIIDFPHQVI